jgi:hypothetical protein
LFGGFVFPAAASVSIGHRTTRRRQPSLAQGNTAEATCRRPCFSCMGYPNVTNIKELQFDC